jgi:hypothetical protein
LKRKQLSKKFRDPDRNERQEEKKPDLIDAAYQMLAKALELGARGYFARRDERRGIWALSILDGMDIEDDGFVSEFAR